MMVVVVVMVGRDGESVPSTHRTSGRGANVLSFWRVCVTGDLVPQLPEPIRVRALEGMRATWCRVDGEGGGLNGWDCRCGLPEGVDGEVVKVAACCRMEMHAEEALVD
jgi:hypothetical protein